jgi:pseudouridine synthase
VASRREAEKFIINGRVSVDGVTVRELGTRVDPLRHRVAVDGRPIARAVAPRYLMLNKPPGYVTTADDPDGRPTVMQLVPPVPGLFPVGRLDVASEGLILLTTDGEWAQRASHPRYGCLKEYVVDLTGDAAPDVLATMRAPMAIGPDDRTTGARVDLISSARQRARLRIVLHEGRNRQIRRMCETVGLDVVELVRVRVGGISIGKLAPGEWRDLAAHEIEMISRHVATKPPASVLRGVRRAGAPDAGALPVAGRRTAARREAPRG